MPSPITSASRIAHTSPVPAQTMFGSDGATAIAPIACAVILSKTGTNVLTSSTDFQTPPEAEPRYQVRTSPGTPVMDATRPPNDGPIIWNWSGGGAWPRPPAPPRPPGGCAAASAEQSGTIQRAFRAE